jgi:GNAT superfamily N-acetyltransferase
VSLTVAASAPEDLPAILAATRSAGVFNDDEVATVEELFTSYRQDPQGSGYNFLSCRQADRLLGFACWGPTSLSKGATDLYWICTAREAQGRGAATALFHAVEAGARGLGRWLIVIWTSSRPEYEPARRFYLSVGCDLQTQITDFYDRGDDLCVFVRRL